MKKPGFAFLLCLIATQQTMAVAGTPDVIRFEPGPQGGERISTPWGNYIAMDAPGAVTVMREGDYARARGDAVMRQAEGVSFTSADKGAVDPYWIDGALPRISVGETQLASIGAGLVFGKEGASTRHFAVLWVQSTRTSVTPILFDFDKQKAFRGSRCGFDPGSQFHHCDIAVPSDALTDRAALTFIAKGEAPGMMPTSTVAKMSYASIKAHSAELKRSGILIDPQDPADDTFRDLAKLHVLDPSIPTTPY